MRGSGYESLRVTAFSSQKSTQGCHNPPPPVFFRTMTVGAAQGLSEVSIMPLAAISRISSSAALRLTRGSLCHASEWGQWGLCQCYAAPELSWYSPPLRLQKFPQNLSIGVTAAPAAACLNAHHFAAPTPQQQQQSQVTGRQMECVVVMAGVCWSELQYSSRAPPESLQLLCDGCGLEPVSTDVWAAAAGRWPLCGGSGPTKVARSRYQGTGGPLARRHMLPSGPTSPSQQCSHLWCRRARTRGASGSSPPPQTTASFQALLSFHPWPISPISPMGKAD